MTTSGGPIGEPACPGDPGRVRRIAELLEQGVIDDGKLLREVDVHTEHWLLNCPAVTERVQLVRELVRSRFYPDRIATDVRSLIAAELREIVSLASEVEARLTGDHVVVLRVLARASDQSMIQEDIASAAEAWFEHALERTKVGELLGDLRELGYVERLGGESGRRGDFITPVGCAWLDRQPPLVQKPH